jgi:glycosyltransferase involved in cell wall biosynthesis
MENNSPECIAKNIIKALNNPNLEQIGRNARNLAEREFTFDAAVGGYRRILESLKPKA